MSVRLSIRSVGKCGVYSKTCAWFGYTKWVNTNGFGGNVSAYRFAQNYLILAYGYRILKVSLLLFYCYFFHVGSVTFLDI